MNLDFYEMINSMVSPILFGLMAIFLLSIGLRGILIRRPFLVSNRWFLSIIFVIAIPMFLLNFSLLLSSSFNAIYWVLPLLFGVLLLVAWFQFRGYTAYAVTDTSFREALRAALQKLQLPYEERHSVIWLTSVKAALQVSSVQSRMGTGGIKVKQRTHQPVLREIVNAMNEYFRISSVPTKMLSCVFSLIMGAIMVIVAIGMSFFRGIF